MSGPADWYEAAEARHAHLPSGAERERRVQRTYMEIRDEAEGLCVRLPELDNDEKVHLLEESVLDIAREFPGGPLSDLEEELFAARVDHLYYRLCLAAREQKAAPDVRGRLIARRLARRWTA